MECCVCFEKYDTQRRKINLKCNHKFCCFCIARLEIDDSKVCPLCKEEWTDVLSSKYERRRSLLLKKEKQEAQTKIPIDENYYYKPYCSRHDYHIKFWCFDCEALICRICTSSTHKGHEFEITEDDKSITSMKNDLNKIFDEGKNKLSENIYKYRGEIKELEDLALNITGLRNYLNVQVREVEKTIKKIKEVSSSDEEILSNLSSIKKMSQDIDKYHSGYKVASPAYSLDPDAVYKHCKEKLKKIHITDKYSHPQVKPMLRQILNEYNVSTYL